MVRQWDFHERTKLAAIYEDALKVEVKNDGFLFHQTRVFREESSGLRL